MIQQVNRSEAGIQSGKRFLISRVGDCIIALDLNQVRQVIDKDIIYPVPLVSDAVMGVVYYQGTALPVLRPESLAALMGKDISILDKSRSELILVMEWQDHQVGILLDRIEWVVESEELEINDNNDESSIQTIRYRGTALFSLDAQRIFALIKHGLADPRSPLSGSNSGPARETR